MSSSEIQPLSWEAKDAQYEAAFALPESMRESIANEIRLIFRRPSKLPSLNAYRNHIVQGLEEGHLPVDGEVIDVSGAIQMLQSEDFDQTAGRGNREHRSIISSEDLRVRLSKLRIDLIAGKIPLFTPDETEEAVSAQSDVE